MNATRMMPVFQDNTVLYSGALRCFRAFLTVGLLLIAASTHAQSGRYFLTDGWGFHDVWEFQGGALVSNFPAVPGNHNHGPIVVDRSTNRIRTVEGTGEAARAAPGAEHDLTGRVLGAVSLDLSAHPGEGRVIDAGFDGKNSYVVAADHLGLGLMPAAVYQFNADFSGPGTLLFKISDTGANTAQGITYDTQTNTIWTSDFVPNSIAGHVRQFSLTGVQLFSFPVVDASGNGSERNTALAYDASDDTFWLNAQVETTLGFSIGELWQFDRNGNFLEKIHGAQLNPSAPSRILYWGGEILPIPAIPEPSTLVLVLIGLSIALSRRHLR